MASSHRSSVRFFAKCLRIGAETNAESAPNRLSRSCSRHGLSKAPEQKIEAHHHSSNRVDSSPVFGASSPIVSIVQRDFVSFPPEPPPSKMLTRKRSGKGGAQRACERELLCSGVLVRMLCVGRIRGE